MDAFRKREIEQALENQLREARESWAGFVRDGAVPDDLS